MKVSEINFSDSVNICRYKQQPKPSQKQLTKLINFAGQTKLTVALYIKLKLCASI